jgi:heme A synthase
MQRQLKYFSIYSWAFLVFNIYAILGGAFVRATGSGAGCGAHWPLCEGKFVPHFGTLHTIIEFSHRVSSGIVGIGAVIFIIWAFLSTQRKDSIRKAATVAFIFVLFEALLGAGLVLFGLVADNSSITRAVVTSLHLVSTFILIASIALASAWSSGLPVAVFSGQTKKKLFFVFLLTFGLILTGATGAITALGDTLFRPHYVAERLFEDIGFSSHFLKNLRIYHPIFAILMSFFTVVCAFEWTKKESTSIQKKLSIFLVSLILVQVICGFSNIFLLAPVWLQIVHLFLGDLVWIVSILFFNVVLTKENQ